MFKPGHNRIPLEAQNVTSKTIMICKEPVLSSKSSCSPLKRYKNWKLSFGKTFPLTISLKESFEALMSQTLIPGAQEKAFHALDWTTINKEIWCLAGVQISIQTLPISLCMEKQDSKAISDLKPKKQQRTYAEQSQENSKKLWRGQAAWGQQSLWTFPWVPRRKTPQSTLKCSRDYV